MKQINERPGFSKERQYYSKESGVKFVSGCRMICRLIELGWQEELIF